MILISHFYPVSNVVLILLLDNITVTLTGIKCGICPEGAVFEYENEKEQCRVKQEKPFQSFEGTASLSARQQMLNKVPEVTIFFWIIKVLATTVGETAADLLNVNLNLGLTITTVIMSILFIAALSLQFRARRYVPGIYWLTVVLISVVGTLITDNLTDNLGIPLETTTIIFSVALIASFIAWYASEKTLSVHTIYTTKREAFYWLVILFTFALGTAGGDLMSEGLNLGYAASLLIFAGMIAIVAAAHFAFKLNAVASFWMAYVLTRPLGASLGDYLSQPRSNGGLGLGTIGTSAIFLLTILGLVIYLSKTKRDALPAGMAEIE